MDELSLLLHGDAPLVVYDDGGAMPPPEDVEPTPIDLAGFDPDRAREVQAMAALQHAETLDLEIVAVAAAGPPRTERRYEQPGWQVCEHARMAKRVKTTQKENERAHALANARASQARLIVAEFPLIAKRLGVSGVQKGTLSEGRGLMLTRRAFLPAIRGRGQCRNAQKKACTVIAEVMLETENDFTVAMLTAGAGATVHLEETSGGH